MPIPTMRILGERVHILRRRKGWSQQQLATCAGMSPTTLSNLEKGKLSTVSIEHLVALSRVLVVRTDCLLGLEELADTELLTAMAS